jgi:hypothetical protein
MRDRPQSGSRQDTECANSDNYRREFRRPGVTVVQIIVVALMLVQLGLSQTLFDVPILKTSSGRKLKPIVSMRRQPA